MNSDAGDPYLGGTAFSSGSPGSTAYPDAPSNPLTTHAADRVFHANLVTVPEPVSALLVGFGAMLLRIFRRR